MTKPNDNEELDLVEVHKVWGPAEAEVIKTMLESYGISCLMRGEVPQSLFPFSTDGMGEIKILVLRKDLAKAKNLIAQISQEKEE
jgi:hypothetical protein